MEKRLSIHFRRKQKHLKSRVPKEFLPYSSDLFFLNPFSLSGSTEPAFHLREASEVLRLGTTEEKPLTESYSSGTFALTIVSYIFLPIHPTFHRYNPSISSSIYWGKQEVAWASTPPHREHGSAAPRDGVTTQNSFHSASKQANNCCGWIKWMTNKMIVKRCQKRCLFFLSKVRNTVCIYIYLYILFLSLKVELFWRFLKQAAASMGV